ncbi:MAG TPA: hypothetical protein VEI25_10890 [Paraburkholderia sp.]|nr:hypothetical protein [Paraburkholderia sp.]
MSSIMIQDLPRARELDRHAMLSVRGGTGSTAGGPWMQGLGPVASPTVNVAVNQSINQLQYVNVEALNNIGVLGADLGPVNFNVNPTLWAKNTAVV